MKTTNWQMIRFSSSIAAYCIIRLRIELLLLPWTQALGYSAGLAGNVFCFCLQDRKHLDWNILPVQTNNLLWHIQAHMDVLCLNGYPWLCGICVYSECHFFVGIYMFDFITWCRYARLKPDFSSCYGGVVC